VVLVHVSCVGGAEGGPVSLGETEISVLDDSAKFNKLGDANNKLPNLLKIQEVNSCQTCDVSDGCPIGMACGTCDLKARKRTCSICPAGKASPFMAQQCTDCVDGKASAAGSAQCDWCAVR